MHTVLFLCASLLRIISRVISARHARVISASSSTRTYRTLGDLCQAKLGWEINGRFLLNEHGDPSFLLHKFKCHLVDYDISRFKENLNTPH